MLFYDGFSDWKSYTKTTPVRSRFVRTIKPVEQPIKFYAAYGHIGIIHQDSRVFSSSESHSYHSLWIAVLYSIIH